MEKFQDAPKEAPKSIDDFNREQEAKKKEKELEDASTCVLYERIVEKPKSVFVTPKGNNKCMNKGCLKEYDPKDEAALGNEACRYHPGEACFHDLKKFWTCCKVVLSYIFVQVEKYDWDEFMAIKPCAVGKHTPKMV
jgi:hypothetical protein